MVNPVLSVGAYLLGVAWIAGVAAATVRAAVVVRRTWLADLSRLAAGVAMAVVVISQLTLAAEVLGAIAQLRPVPFLVLVLVSSALIDLWSRRRTPDLMPSDRVAPLPSSPTERYMAALGVMAVAAQWVDHTADALSRGMTHADTLWYHGPYSARFLQTGSLGDLGTLGYAQSRFFPLGSELLHAVVALPFHRDVLSPVVNLGFAALAIGAAAAIGERWGVAALSAVATTMVLGLPTLAGTQPGQASNDVVAAALLLSAAALWLHAATRPVPLALAGLSLGLAVGTKVTVLALAGPLGLAVLVITWRASRRASALSWAVGVVAAAICWPLRNLVLLGTPAPWINIALGPWHKAAIAPPNGTPSLVRSINDGPWWPYAGGLSRGFGPLWPVVLLSLAGGLVGLVRGPTRLRVLGGTAVIGAIAYAFTPFTGASSFQFNLRYLTPSLLLSCIVLVAVIAPLQRTRQLVRLALVTVITVNLFAAHHERVPAWSGHWAAALLTAATIASVFLVSQRNPSFRATPTVVLVVLGAVVVGGWPVQRSYLEGRYVATGLVDDSLNAAFRTTSHKRVDVLGTPEVYPMFGAELSNSVQDRTTELFFDAPASNQTCQHWRSLLHSTDRVAISSFGFLLRRFSAAERYEFFGRDKASTLRYDDGERAVYDVDGSLDPATCRSVATAGA